MQQVRKLITQIRALLGGAPPLLPLESLAAEYARLRDDAARRLEACAAMLAKGSEHSALELAEAKPPLLDLIAELSFAEEPHWQALCASNGLSLGAPLDARTVAALDAVYAKGISPNSPLYQDYRAAVTGRDDSKALHIIRTIARINPSDANAQAELDRLRNKFMHAKLEALRASFTAGDDAASADLVDELEELATVEKLQTQSDYTRGLAVRKRVRLASASRDLPALLEDLDRLKQSGDWRRAAERLAELDAQESELGLTLDAAQSSRRDAVRRFVEDENANAAEQHRFLQAVERFRVGGEQAATRAAGASTLTLEEAHELEARFDQLEHEVKQFRRTVPADAAASIDASRKAVHGAGARIRRGILLRRVAVVGLVVALVGAGLAWIGRSALVKSYVNELADFQQQGKPLAAQELLQKIKSHNVLGIHSAPDLQAAMAEAGRWVAGVEELRLQAQAQIQALESETPEKANAAEIYKKFEAASTLTSSLPSDIAAPLRERIAVVQRRFDAHFAKVREENLTKWRATFAEAESLLQPLNFDTPTSQVDAAVAKAGPLLKTLESDVNHPVPVLRPDADMIAAYQGVVKKEEDLRSESAVLAASRTAMLQAESLDVYTVALKSYAGARFAETQLAQPALKEIPEADDPPARLLMDGDREAWAVVKKDKIAGAAMRPMDVRQEEIALLLSLRDDPDLRDVWQWTLVGQGGTRVAFSRGMLREYSVGGDVRYDGKLWDPNERHLTPIFIEVKLTKSGGPVNVSSFSLSPASQLLDTIKLQAMDPLRV